MKVTYTPMVFNTPIIHVIQDVFRLFNDEVRSLCDDVEILVCDEAGSLQDPVLLNVQTSHLEYYIDIIC
jgi:hypothetical protein